MRHRLDIFYADPEVFMCSIPGIDAPHCDCPRDIVPDELQEHVVKGGHLYADVQQTPGGEFDIVLSDFGAES